MKNVLYKQTNSSQLVAFSVEFQFAIHPWNAIKELKNIK